MTAVLDLPDLDLEGEMFGSVLVIQRADDGMHWHALCECNEAFLAVPEDLTSGFVTSCGCADKEPRGTGYPALTSTRLSSRWKSQALCAQVGGDSFHPDRGGRAAVAKAKSICLQCDVRVQCLEWALDIGDPHGVWGGLTADERRTLMRQRKVRPAEVGHCGSCGGDDHEFVDCSAAGAE